MKGLSTALDSRRRGVRGLSEEVEAAMKKLHAEWKVLSV